jgi:thiol-disulfide isomerase/thioredoxin
MSGVSPRRSIPAALSLLVLLAACAADDAVPPAGGEPALIVATGAGLTTSVDELPATDVDDFDRIVGAAAGTPLVVNVWASWCEPCERETPLLADAARAHPDVQFIGIDVLDTRTGARAFIDEHDIPYPSLFDAPGAIMTDLGALGPPLTAFYDADGTQVEVVRGEISPSDLQALLDRIGPP